MHRWNRIFLIISCSILVSISGMLLLMPKKAFSDIENRYLASFPKLTWNNIRSGQFGKELENYVADHFPFRDAWVNVKAQAELALNKKENNDVYAGADGYLLQKLPSPSIQLERQMSYIHQFAEGIDIPLYFMLVPNSAEILSEKLPKFAPKPEQEAYLKHAYELLGTAGQVINSYELLDQHKDEYIYYRTDHHWTTLGAYYGYLAFANEANIAPMKSDEFTITQVSEQFYGTLYAKSNFRHISPDSIDVWTPNQSLQHTVSFADDPKVMDELYDWKQLEKRDQYPLFLGGNHAITVIDTPEAPNKTLLILKDSYAHSFVPFLTQHYNSIYMLDLRYTNISAKEYAKQIDADEVLMLYNIASFQSDDSLVKLKW